MIFVDLCMYTDPSVLNDQLLESMRHGEQGIAECQYSRWVGSCGARVCGVIVSQEWFIEGVRV